MIINNINLFVIKTDGELADLYKQLIKLKETGCIPDGTLKEISREYIRRYNHSGISVMQEDLFRVIADRWYRNDMSSLIEAVTWDEGVQLAGWDNTNKEINISFKSKKKYTFIKRHGKYYVVKDNKELKLNLSDEEFNKQFVQI